MSASQVISQQLIEIEMAARELDACRRPPDALRHASRHALLELMRARGVDVPAAAAGAPLDELLPCATRLLDGRMHAHARRSCAALVSEVTLARRSTATPSLPTTPC